MDFVTLTDLEGAVEGTACPQWRAALPNVARARDGIERFLANGGHAYGFSTFLGHLDEHGLSEDVQPLVLEAHLVGQPEQLALRQSRAITAIKLSQLSQAHSGISPEIFEHLVRNFDQLPPVSTDLGASYGSGDVVPASWWAHSLLPAGLELRNGDVIALINGHFIAPGLLLAAYADVKRSLSLALDQVQAAQTTLEADRVQLSVAMRDITPLQELLATTWDQVDTALVRSANSSSGNPQFDEVADGSYQAISNSSFLNLSLTQALFGLCYTVSAVSTYLRSATYWVCKNLESRDGELIHGTYFVQPPKISKALNDRVCKELPSTPSLTQSESNMVEDVADTAVHTVQSVLRAADLVGKQTAILTEALRLHASEPATKPLHGFGSAIPSSSDPLSASEQAHGLTSPCASWR